MEPLFRLGQVCATLGALALKVDLRPYLRRHITGDWGDLHEDDKKANDAALVEELRILSAYNIGNARLWIITEADRSSTTCLLPEEY